MSIFINFEEEEEEYKYEDIARPPLMRNDLLDKPGRRTRAFGPFVQLP
jgi:hypothetical protein